MRDLFKHSFDFSHSHLYGLWKLCNGQCLHPLAQLAKITHKLVNNQVRKLKSIKIDCPGHQIGKFYNAQSNIPKFYRQAITSFSCETEIHRIKITSSGKQLKQEEEQHAFESSIVL